MIDKTLLFQLIFDSGMLVLIYLTQLVIYPSFTYFIDERLKRWHSVYTGKMTIVVLPLMLGQLICATSLLYTNINVFSVSRITTIIAAWVLTFIMAVPLHNKLDRDMKPHDIAKKLVRINWPRTILWTIVFGITLMQVLRGY